MRIMIVNSYYFPEIMGGAEYSVKKLAEELQRNKHEVCVLCTGSEDCHEVVDGINVYRFKPLNAFRSTDSVNASRVVKRIHWFQNIWNPRSLKKIKREILQFHPDIIHTNGLYDISPIVWKAAKSLDIRLIHTLRDYHLLCPCSALTCNANPVQCENLKRFCKIHRNRNLKHSKYVDCVTAPSSVTLSVLKEHGFFKDVESVVIPNATDFNIDAVKAIYENRQQQSVHPLKFVYLGNLSEQKGIRWMVESFLEILDPNISLFIAGKGDLEDYVCKSSTKDRRISFVGFLNEEGVNNLLNACDVLICPSLWKEPFGRVVLDAYKHAMPVIASDRGALPELVADGETGSVVTGGDREMLCSAIKRYINNPKLCLEQGYNAIARLEQFSLKHQAEKFERVYIGTPGD